MKIISDQKYVAGWLDSSIHDFFQVLSSNASTRYALVTCLDSNRNPAALRNESPELRPLAEKLKIVGDALILRTDLLLNAKTAPRIFFGFDELWLFPHKSVTRTPPPGLLVGPARLDHSRFKKIVRWMSANDCSMALGGGEGMNFVVRAQGLVKLLLGYSIEQPDSSTPSLELVNVP